MTTSVIFKGENGKITPFLRIFLVLRERKCERNYERIKVKKRRPETGEEKAISGAESYMVLYNLKYLGNYIVKGAEDMVE